MPNPYAVLCTYILTMVVCRHCTLFPNGATVNMVCVWNGYRDRQTDADLGIFRSDVSRPPDAGTRGKAVEKVAVDENESSARRPPLRS